MKIALFGYGKMGQMIASIIEEQKKAGLHDDQVILTKDKDVLDKAGKEKLKAADVIIEFSTPETAFDNILSGIYTGIPVISGTTGWLDRFDEMVQIVEEKNGAFLYASNFSIGVNIVFEINTLLARMMESNPQYNMQIEEIHHIHKLDAPSGTAITLAGQIIKNVSRKNKWVNNESIKPNELVILSHREDEVPGTHNIEYSSAVDSIRFEHQAHSRKGFAEGAIQAARWIIGRKGVFSMRDVLNINHT
jgi:4-hydroxy-tetrahydrodipicolinate reductase